MDYQYINFGLRHTETAYRIRQMLESGEQLHVAQVDIGFGIYTESVPFAYTNRRYHRTLLSEIKHTLRQQGYQCKNANEVLLIELDSQYTFIELLYKADWIELTHDNLCIFRVFSDHNPPLVYTIDLSMADEFEIRQLNLRIPRHTRSVLSSTQRCYYFCME